MKKQSLVWMMLHLLMFPLLAVAQVNEHQVALDSLRQEFQADIDLLKDEFEEYSRKSFAEYEKYEKQAKADYLRYVQSIQKVWGGDSVCENTRNQWVEYSDNYSSRSVVDFKNGHVRVEVAIEASEADDWRLADRCLENAVERLLNSRGSTSPYPSSVEVAEPLTERPVLENLIDLSSYDLGVDFVTSELPRPIVKGKNLSDNTEKKKVKESNGAKRKVTPKVESWSKKVNRIARKVVSSNRKLKETVVGADGKSRQVVQVEMSLVADNLSRNAALYKDLVAEFSERFQVEQPLIYAIMEQESYFNPEATSWVPAYGLMQIVPKSGGRDAYLYVYKKDWLPTRSYLYNPRNNIELGTAYLRVLMNQFASVSDSHCRRLCVIAGYNTGAGNVSRSFIGTTNLSKAFAHINRCNYNELFNHLITKLPYEETRNYVVKVTQRREKYLKQ